MADFLLISLGSWWIKSSAVFWWFYECVKLNAEPHKTVSHTHTGIEIGSWSVHKWIWLCLFRSQYKMTCTCCRKHAASCEISYFSTALKQNTTTGGEYVRGAVCTSLISAKLEYFLKCDVRRGVVLRLGKWQIDTLPLFAGTESVCVRWMKHTSESWLSCHSWEEAAEFSCTDAATPARHVNEIYAQRNNTVKVEFLFKG